MYRKGELLFKSFLLCKENAVIYTKVIFFCKENQIIYTYNAMNDNFFEISYHLWCVSRINGNGSLSNNLVVLLKTKKKHSMALIKMLMINAKEFYVSFKPC